MRQEARTPEELEALLEDACVTRDVEALAVIFAEGAVLCAGNAAREARGRAEIERLVRTLWNRGRTYVAEPQQVVQAGDLALVVGSAGINVVRRGSDRGWRFAISLLSPEPHDTKEDQ